MNSRSQNQRLYSKEINGKKAEPVEFLVIDVPKEFDGQVISLLGARRGEMLNMRESNGRINFEFKLPSRGLVGLRLRLLSSTQEPPLCITTFMNTSISRETFHTGLRVSWYL